MAITKTPPQPTSKTPWQTIALTSGAFAALNAILAKLTTNDLTTTLSTTISSYLPIIPEHYLTLALRILVFALSFSSTGIMWTLYTRALSLSPSAVHVNIVNTSSNFITTAILGALVFRERLPLMWWVGAGFLVAGSVWIAKGREETDKEKGE